MYIHTVCDAQRACSFYGKRHAKVVLPDGFHETDPPVRQTIEIKDLAGAGGRKIEEVNKASLTQNGIAFR